MKEVILRLTLKSAATFGRGDGLMGVVDHEIEHDLDGFPFMRGKTLKGLLGESAENIVYALALQNQTKWRLTKDQLFGQPGRGTIQRGIMHVTDAKLPAHLRHLIQTAYDDPQNKINPTWTPDIVLELLTGIRTQTAVTPFGAPDAYTLRSMRVLLRDVSLESQLTFDVPLSTEDQTFLAATVLDFRRAGTGRNRGRGWLQTALLDSQQKDETQQDLTQSLFNQFKQAVTA